VGKDLLPLDQFLKVHASHLRSTGVRVTSQCSLSAREKAVFCAIAGRISHMTTAKGERNSLWFNLRMPKLSNVVIREVRDRDGRKLGRIIQLHNGTEPGVITAAQAATDRMYAEFSAASNVQSRICATDSTGNPEQVTSSNFLRGAHRCDVNLPAYRPTPLEPRGANRSFQPVLQDSLRQDSPSKSASHRACASHRAYSLGSLLETGKLCSTRPVAARSKHSRSFARGESGH